MGEAMKHDDSALQGGAPDERRETSLPRSAAPLRYVPAPAGRREPQLAAPLLGAHTSLTGLTAHAPATTTNLKTLARSAARTIGSSTTPATAATAIDRKSV